MRRNTLRLTRAGGNNAALPAAVLRVALSHSLLQLHVEERQLLPALLFQNLVEDGGVEVIHGVSCLQQEVVPHGLEVSQEPDRGKDGVRLRGWCWSLNDLTFAASPQLLNLTCSPFLGFSWGSRSTRCISCRCADTGRSAASARTSDTSPTPKSGPPPRLRRRTSHGSLSALNTTCEKKPNVFITSQPCRILQSDWSEVTDSFSRQTNTATLH